MTPWISLTIQGAGTLVWSLLVCRFVGWPSYLLVGALVLSTCALLLIRVECKMLILRDDETIWWAIGSIAVLSISFGAFWPAIPIAFAWGALRDRLRGGTGLAGGGRPAAAGHRRGRAHPRPAHRGLDAARPGLNGAALAPARSESHPGGHP